MVTIYLDGTSYHTAAEVHSALKMLLNLPDYYGGNADALHDCLSEREGIHLYVARMGEGEVADCLRKVIRAVEDADGRVTAPQA